MKRMLYALLALLLLAAACDKPPEQALADLSGDDDAKRQAAIKLLGKKGEPLLPRLAPLLSSDKEKERGAALAVMRRLGVKAQPTMLDQVGAVWKGKDVHDGFVDYFRGLGAPGYQALLGQLWEVGTLAGQETTAGSMSRLEQINHQFESLSLVLEGLDNLDDVGRTPELLRNAYAKVRIRAAYLLCLKGWTPKNRQDATVYYTHLMSTLQCSKVPEPAQDAARLAAADLTDFLKTEEEYPSGGATRLQVLALAATDEAADYVCGQALKTPSEFQLVAYFRALKGMENDRAAACVKRLLADRNTGGSIRALDPAAAAAP